MSEYLVTRIKKTRGRLRHVDASFPARNVKVVGFDSEADTSTQGEPMMFQFSLPDTSEEDTLLYTLKSKPNIGLVCILAFLQKYCIKHPKDDKWYIFVWNLSYELTQIFHDLTDEIRTEPTIRFQTHLVWTPDKVWDIEIINDVRQYLSFTMPNGRNPITIDFVDGMSFYKTGLGSAATMLGLGEKYKSDGVDRSHFTRADLTNEEYRRYAKRDAYITRRIGEYIVNQHRIFNIPITKSAPQFASVIFRTNFLNGGYPAPSETLEQAGLYSYHGGKNGYYLDSPSEFPLIWNYDIVSAYPEAMQHLPDIENSSWWHIKGYEPNKHALYKVTLDYQRCLYRGMQRHDGSWANSGLVTDTWITSYELDAIIDNNEATILDCEGWVYDGPRGGALTNYVTRYFEVKRISTGPERETAKLLLNSLYGKFFEKQPLGSVGIYSIDDGRWIVTDPTEDFDYEAGVLYNPPIASLITGYVRGRIHRLEHRFGSVMTSTDGFFGTVPPNAGDLGSHLGGLKATPGRLRIWRERLYIFDGNDGQRKAALHGFHSGIAELEKIPLATGEYRYQGKQMITLKMANNQYRGPDGVMRRQYEPGTFVMMEKRIKI